MNILNINTAHFSLSKITTFAYVYRFPNIYLHTALVLMEKMPFAPTKPKPHTRECLMKGG